MRYMLWDWKDGVCCEFDQPQSLLWCTEYHVIFTQIEPQNKHRFAVTIRFSWMSEDDKKAPTTSDNTHSHIVCFVKFA